MLGVIRLEEPPLPDVGVQGLVSAEPPLKLVDPVFGISPVLDTMLFSFFKNRRLLMMMSLNTCPFNKSFHSRMVALKKCG